MVLTDSQVDSLLKRFSYVEISGNPPYFLHGVCQTLLALGVDNYWVFNTFVPKFMKEYQPIFDHYFSKN